jgi:large subunit ribosomal protein L19
MDLIHELEKESMKRELPDFSVGDTIDVECIIREETKAGGPKGAKGAKAAKERKSIFTGVVLGIKGRGIRRTFTVRRIVQGEGVERVFPFHSPLVTGVKIRKRGLVRRAKLYYLKNRSGKSARIRERITYSKTDSNKKS